MANILLFEPAHNEGALFQKKTTLHQSMIRAATKQYNIMWKFTISVFLPKGLICN